MVKGRAVAAEAGRKVGSMRTMTRMQDWLMIAGGLVLLTIGCAMATMYPGERRVTDPVPLLQTDNPREHHPVARPIKW